MAPSTNSNSTTPIYFQGPIRHQSFSLLDSVIFYIAKNPFTSKVNQNLIQCCKYFFAKNPIIVLSCLHYTSNGWKTYPTKRKLQFFKCQKNIIINKNRQKLWVTDFLYMNSLQSITPPPVIPKLYQCDVNSCFLFRQNLTLNEFLFLAKSAVVCDLRECTVKDDMGASVLLENLISNLPKLESFSILINFSGMDLDASVISKNTVKEFLKIPHFSRIKQFYLFKVPDSFDIETMYKYLKTTRKRFQLSLSFCDSLSPNYITRVEAVVDDMLEPYRYCNYVFPFISIPNFYLQKQRAFAKRFRENFHLWK